MVGFGQCCLFIFKMKFLPLQIPGLILFEPTVYEDARGCFFESFNAAVFEQATGHAAHFVQDNHSISRHGVLRGLHYQEGEHAQGKLVRVVQGAVHDVAVDIRPGSPTYGRWQRTLLSAENRLHKWIPPGFAHGFVVLSQQAEVVYKTTAFYAPQAERCIAWDDPVLAIDWGFEGQPVLSEKDARGGAFEPV